MTLRLPVLTAATLFFVGLSALADEPATDDHAPDVAPVINVLTDQPSAPVGTIIDSVSFRDLGGNEYYLNNLTSDGPVVFVVLSTQCPMAQRYTQRLHRLHDEFAAQGVSFFAVYPNDEETRDGLTDYCERAQFPFPVVKDNGGYIAAQVGATLTPQAFLIDTLGVLRYRGGIDDNRYENRVREHFLHDALSQVLAGETVTMTEGPSFGCTVHCAVPAESETVTYSSHVARLLQDNCQSCHRPGEVAPFSLTNYEEAQTWADEIKAYTAKRLMPPWKAAPGFGEFLNDCSMSDEQIALIGRWVDAGAPLGDPRDVPPSPEFRDGWELGEPDYVVEMEEEYVLGPEGDDDYRHFIVKNTLDDDVYVEAIDVEPGNRKAVHHVIVYVDKHNGKARELDAADPGPGYTNFGGPGFDPISGLGGWAPGTPPETLPKGTGRLLPKGSDIVIQVHYYRTGFEERDRTKIGLYFSREKDPVRLHTAAAHPHPNRFRLPPGDNRIELNGHADITQPVYLISVYPHMHLLGREMQVVAEHPDWDEPVPLVWIKDWDFNWQMGYELKEPLFLPKGAKVRLVAYYDNSADNPHNPHSPPEPVGYGERTTDEMCFAFFNVVGAEKFDRLRERQAVAGD